MSGQQGGSWATHCTTGRKLTLSLTLLQLCCVFVFVLCPVQRVADVYAQQCREVQDPQLPADTATQLVGHMLALQAEGVTPAQVRVH